jgi:biopolymer transport protein TolQ
MSDVVVKASDMTNKFAAADMSIFGLISHADTMVKLVMLLLGMASIWSWAIIFDKYVKFNSLNNKSDKFEKLFWSGQLLEQLYERIKGRTDHPLANIFISAMHEWSRSGGVKDVDPSLATGLKERLFKSMELIINRETDKIEKHLSFLAIVASNAPFIGLFGTVWGIMHSFQAIAASKNTSLAVVAPGIAEALLATAIGLMVAIPAAIFYNILVNKLNNFSSRMEDFSAELGALLSREIDEGRK